MERVPTWVLVVAFALLLGSGTAGIAYAVQSSSRVDTEIWTDMGGNLWHRCDGTTGIYGTARGMDAVPDDPRCAAG